jgi:lysozyme family protein
MAFYKIAIAKVLLAEKGYSKDPQDVGGETYDGISRCFFPSWKGWKIVDEYKNKMGFPINLRDSVALNTMVKEFYKINFWDKIKGDSIKNQSIANLLVDSAVNEGIIPAIKRAQEIVLLPQTGKVDDLLISKLNVL